MFPHQAYAGYLVHLGKVQFGTLKVGDLVNIKVDYHRRAYVAKNHTATHALNFALRQVLGPKVDQQGSAVKENSFYFDFNANSKITFDQLHRIEEIVNQLIARQVGIYSQECEKNLAIKINVGLGEKNLAIKINADYKCKTFLSNNPESASW